MLDVQRSRALRNCFCSRTVRPVITLKIILVRYFILRFDLLQSSDLFKAFSIFWKRIPNFSKAFEDLSVNLSCLLNAKSWQDVLYSCRKWKQNVFLFFKQTSKQYFSTSRDRCLGTRCCETEHARDMYIFSSSWVETGS